MDFLDFVRQLEDQPTPVPERNDLPNMEMLTAYMEGKNFGDTMPQRSVAMRGGVPAMDAAVPELPPQTTAAGEYGSGAGGVMAQIADFMSRSSVSVGGRGGRRASFRGGNVGKPSRLERTNVGLADTHETATEARREAAAEALRKAPTTKPQPVRKASRYGQPLKDRAKGKKKEATAELPEHVMRWLGDDAPPSNIVPKGDAGKWWTRARRAENKATKAPPVIKVSPKMKRDLIRQENYYDGDVTEDAVIQAALRIVLDMISRARTEADLLKAAEYIRDYPATRVAAQGPFHEKATAIGDSR